MKVRLLIGMLLLFSKSVYSLAAPGEVIWKFPTGAPVLSSPALSSDGILYVGSYDQFLYAIQASDGVLRWKYSLQPLRTNEAAYVFASPCIGEDGTIYFGTEERNFMSAAAAGTFYALNSDGTLRWKFPLGAAIYSDPAVGPDGTIYFGAFDSNLYALNSDGTLKWKFRAAGTIFSDPAIALDGTIYFGCDDDKLYALNPNGTRKWTFDTGGPITASPAIGSKGTVYIGTTTAMKLFAVNPDGSKAWEFQAAERIYSSAALAADGTIYFGSNDGHLYALDEIGTLKWKFAAGALVRSSPAIAADGTVYFGVENGTFFAINASGDLSWSVLTENYIYSSPVIDPMGAIYFASADNSVYALTGAARLAGTPWSMFRSDPRHLGRAVPMMDSPPALSPIANVTILKNEVAGPIAFTVQDSETPAENLLLRVETSDPVLVPEANIVLNGSGSNRSLTLTPAPEQIGSATITIYVMDSAGHTASTRFTLTVLPGDPVPAPRILSVEISGGAVTILWTSVPGEIYQVQSASDLVSPRWENLPGEIVAQEESASKKDLAELEQQKFYRVVHLP